MDHSGQARQDLDGTSETLARQQKAALDERRRAFGESMRDLREEYGATRESLADTTRISVAFIQALEEGQLDRLPGRVFGRGFIQNIAKNFGADPEPLLATYATLWESEAASGSVLKVEIKNRPTPPSSEALSRLLLGAGGLVPKRALFKVGLPAIAAVLMALVVVKQAHLRHGFESAKPKPEAKAKHIDFPDKNEQPEANAAVEAAPPKGDAGETNEAATPVTDGNAPLAAAVTDDETVSAHPAPDAEGAPARPSFAAPPSEAAMIGKSQWAAPEAKAVAKGNALPPAVLPKTTKLEKGDNPPGQPVVTSFESPKGSTAEQVLVLTVTEPVRVRLDVDHGPSTTKELSPDTYTFSFRQHADVMVYDASAVKISFNGRPLGTLGGKGRVRRLSFQGAEPTVKSM